MHKNSFTLEKVVTFDDIDDLNHVNNAVYVKWMDDVAFPIGMNFLKTMI